MTFFENSLRLISVFYKKMLNLHRFWRRTMPEKDGVENSILQMF